MTQTQSDPPPGPRPDTSRAAVKGIITELEICCKADDCPVLQCRAGAVLRALLDEREARDKANARTEAAQET